VMEKMKNDSHTASAGGAATAAAETAHRERYLWPDDAAPYRMSRRASFAYAEAQR
jgi:hypothetical protein